LNYLIILVNKITIRSPLENYTNITVHGKWNLQTIKKSGFSGNKLDDNMISDLSWSYHNYFDKNILIIDFKISFYQQVTFDILDDSDIASKTEIKIHVGDVIDVSGTSDGDDGGDNDQWFAKVIAIITHKNNDDNCIFLILDWFNYCNFDTYLQCHRYKLQKDTEDWKRIHSITVITKQPKWHFIHDCKNTCVANNHDIVNNRIFYRNDYLYTAA
jgi:hypothetical protein